MKCLSSFLLALLPHLAQADEIYSVQLADCDARLERREVEPELLMIRSACALSLASLAQLLDEGLQGMFPENRIDIRSVQLGRLINYPEWSNALAKAAAQSPAWDTRRGRPKKPNEHANHRVTQLLNGPAYPQALKTVFSRYGLTACIATVEKVLIFKASDIFPSGTENANSITPDARLPFDAQIWLSLQPLGATCGR